MGFGLVPLDRIVSCFNCFVGYGIIFASILSMVIIYYLLLIVGLV